MVNRGTPVGAVTAGPLRATLHVSPGAEEHGMIEAKGYSGTVSFDGEFVTISRGRGLGRLVVGKGEKRIPVRHVTAVQLKPAGGLVNGFIQFSLGGGNELRSKFGRQTGDAGGDENSVIFTRKQQPAFDALRAAAEAAMASAPTRDPMDQLRKLAELRDAGVVTEAEFEAKKTELLS